MTITNGYATLADLKAELSIDDDQDDALLELRIEAASRTIDEYCCRVFYQEIGATKYYTADDHSFLVVDDLVSVTTIANDLSGDRSYSELWGTNDYELEPANAAGRGRPYRYIRAAPLSARFFTTLRRGVKVVGTFGWPAVPAQVKTVCRIQAARYYKRKDAVFGIVGPEQGEMVLPKLDPDLELLVSRLVRAGMEVV